MNSYKLRFLLFFLFILIAVNSAFAQHIVRSVLSSGGKSVSNLSGKLFSNIGELSIDTYSSSTNYLTEGFIQPFYFIVVSIPDVLKTQNISLYPNPASDRVFFSFEKSEQIFLITLYDVQGRQIQLENNIQQVSTSIWMLDISALTDGLYFVKLLTENGLILENIKLIKNR